MPSKPRVFLIAAPSVSRTKGSFDLAPLYEFGEVIVITKEGALPWRDTMRVCSDMQRRLDENGFTDNDYLVWAGGDTLSAVLAGYLLSERGIRTIRWLRWQRRWSPEHNKFVHEGGHYEATDCVMFDDEDPSGVLDNSLHTETTR